VRSFHPSIRKRFGVSLFAALLAMLVITFHAPTAHAATSRTFAADSPFNVLIRNSPTLDPDSAAMMAYTSRSRQLNANLFEYGIPVFTATFFSPAFNVTCSMSGTWGSCPLSQHPMRIPSTATPNVGSDGAMTVIDTTTNSVAEYWRAQRTGSTWSAAWGAVNILSGSGWGGASTGAGASRLAGLIRVSEIQAGLIEHALVLQIDNACQAAVRLPAIKTDGESTRADCIPEGARLQLDPAVNIDLISRITPGERTVALAMQKYGGYVIDHADTAMSVSFERAPGATGTSPGAVYERAGLAWDYYAMPHVPWTRLRVLKTWNG
jgi:hypothetical protein